MISLVISDDIQNVRMNHGEFTGSGEFNVAQVVLWP
jgi:hypothetical protein